MREEDSLHFLKAQVKTRNALKADSDGAAQIPKEAGAAQKDGACVYQHTTSSYPMVYHLLSIFVQI